MSTHNPNTLPENGDSGKNYDLLITNFLGQNIKKVVDDRVPNTLPGDSEKIKEFQEYFSKNNSAITSGLNLEFLTELKARFKAAHPHVLDSQFENIFNSTKVDIHTEIGKKLAEITGVKNEHEALMESRFRGAFHDARVKNIFKKLSLSDLIDANNSPERMKKIYQNNGISSADIASIFVEENPNLTALFNSIGADPAKIATLNSTQRDDLDTEIAVYKNTKVASKELISLLLLTIDTSSKHAVARLFEEVVPTIEFRDIKTFLLPTLAEQHDFKLKLFEKFITENGGTIPVTPWTDETEKIFEDFSAAVEYGNWKIPTRYLGATIGTALFTDKVFAALLDGTNINTEFAKALEQNFDDAAERHKEASKMRDLDVFLDAMEAEINSLNAHEKAKISYDWKAKFLKDNYFTLVDTQGRSTYYKITSLNDFTQ